METGQVVTFIVGFLGFILTLAITAGIVFFLRKPLTKMVAHFIADEMVARYGVMFILILIGLAGLTAAFGAFYPEKHGYFLFAGDSFQFGEFSGFMIAGLLNILNGFANVIKWAALIIAVFYIGETLKNSKSS